MLFDCEQVRGQEKLRSAGIKGIKRKVTWICLSLPDGRQKEQDRENPALQFTSAGWVWFELVLGGTFHYCYIRNYYLSGL